MWGVNLVGSGMVSWPMYLRGQWDHGDSEEGHLNFNWYSEIICCIIMTTILCQSYRLFWTVGDCISICTALNVRWWKTKAELWWFGPKEFVSSVKPDSVHGRCEDIAHCLVSAISLGPLHRLVQVAPGAFLGQGVQLSTGLNPVAKFVGDWSCTSLTHMMLSPLLLI
jgi:hypothetical protein